MGAPPGESFQAAGSLLPNEIEGASTADLSNVNAQVADAGTTAKAENFGTFHDQATNMTFGPNHEKAGFDFGEYEKTLLSQNVLPEFAIEESPRRVPNLYADAGKAKAAHAIFDLQMRYFAIKEQV